MFNLLGTVTYTTNTTNQLTTSTNAKVNFAFLIVGLVIFTVLLVVAIVANFKMYKKAGRPGWACLIPIYNTWVLSEMSGRPGWWGLYPLLSIIPFVGWVGAVVVALFINIDLAHKFGRSTTFGVVGLTIFSLIGILILGFGPAVYSSDDAPTFPGVPVTPPVGPGGSTPPPVNPNIVVGMQPTAAPSSGAVVAPTPSSPISGDPAPNKPPTNPVQ